MSSPAVTSWDDKLRPDGRRDGAGRDAEGLGAALSRLAVSRRRREPVGGAAPRHQRRLHAVVVAPGGEPVPRVPARGRAGAARGPRPARGLPARRVRARLLRRPPRSVSTRCTARPTARRASPAARDRDRCGAAAARSRRVRLDRAGARRRVALPDRRRPRARDRGRGSRPGRRRARRADPRRGRAHR